ncbi:MAG TPA: YciI family protein, partial [Catenuloplanes sp.]
IPEERIAAVQQAFQVYARDLAAAGVLRSADVLQPSTASTTVTLRAGNLQVQDGPFADTKEALAGVFVIEVDDLDAALAWAERCPGAQYGTVEVRPTATAFLDGQWSR